MIRSSIFRRVITVENHDEKPVIPRPVVPAAPTERIRTIWRFSPATNHISAHTVHLKAGTAAPAHQPESGENETSPDDTFRRFRH